MDKQMTANGGKKGGERRSCRSAEGGTQGGGTGGRKGNKKGKRNGKKAIVVRGAFILTVLLVVFLAVAWDNDLTVRAYQVESHKVEETIRLLLITDLHSCRYGDGQKELIEAVVSLEPDLILYGGDIADDEIPHRGTVQVLEGLEGKYPSFYVTGNHEFWSGEANEIKETFRSFGVTVLEGDRSVVQVRETAVAVCGVDDPDGYPRYMDLSYGDQLDLAFLNVDSSIFTVLLAHRPERIDEYLEYPCDLVVSGHAHGGQWRIPGIMNGFLAPNQGFFPKYAGGLYDHGDVTHVVSRGLARESTRVPRLFNPPELVLIEVIPSAKVL